MKEKSIHQPEQVWARGATMEERERKRERERTNERRERGKARQEKARGDESNYEKRATRREREDSRPRARGNASKKSYILGDVTRKDTTQRALRVRIRYVSKYCNRGRKEGRAQCTRGRRGWRCAVKWKSSHNCRGRHRPKNQMHKRVIHTDLEWRAKNCEVCWEGTIILKV